MTPKVLRAFARAREKLSPSNLQDELCCIFKRSMLAELYGLDEVDRVPLSRWYVHDGARPWSAVEATFDAGLADRIWLPGSEPYTPFPGDVLDVQGWSGLRDGTVVPKVSLGHNFVAIVLTSTTVLRLDAAAVAQPGGNGVAPKPGRAAPGAEARVMTWAEIVAKYTSGMAIARLAPRF